MGSGASAGLGAAVSNASDAEIRSAISDLPPEDAQKLRTALQSVLAAEACCKFVVPDKVRLCDEEWFTAALRKASLLDEGMSVERVDMKVLGADQGLTSDTALVELTYTGGGNTSAPEACVVKLPSKDAKVPREAVNRMFQAEIDIYRHLAADLAHKGMVLPTLYFSASPEDPATEGYVMVLEHMTHPSRQPCLQVGSMSESVPMECALLAVKELAGLHSAYWNLSREAVRALEVAPGKPKFAQAAFAHIDDEGRKSWYATNLKQRVVLTAAVFGPGGTAALPVDDTAVAGFRNLGAIVSTFEQVVKRRLGTFLERLRACPQVLSHGDCHCENLFIRPGDDPAAMWFDFATFAFRPALWDVALFVIASLEPEVRSECEETLVKGYHDALLARGVEDYTFRQCLSDYRFCACAGFWNIGGMILVWKEAAADVSFPMRLKANILTTRVAAALEAAHWEDFFQDRPEDSEEQHPLEADKALNFG